MSTWSEFATEAPRIAEIFRRRHRAAGNLCMLGTLREDGFPRISPMEPRFFEDRLWVAGMPDTAKFRDLLRDPRFTLHTATVDTQVSDGDAKIWGTVVDVQEPRLHEGLLQDLFDETGMDLRGQEMKPCFEALPVGAAAVEVGDGHMDVTVWRAGSPERVIRKH
ncbi:pyridoxamine 5'-phosphate oxidase family protein [Pseudonocardia ailaonensis]